MLEVQINGQQVDVSERGLDLSLTNPHLLYDAIPISQISVPTFPATARNQRVFQYYHEPTANGAVPELSWKHYFRGDLIREGFFLLSEASATAGYKGSFDEKLNQFFGDYQDKTLQEIDFGTLPLTLSASGVVTDGGQNAYCLPTIINADYFADNGGGYGGKMNDYVSGAYAGSSTPKVPHFFVPYILQRIATLTRTTITGNFLTHATWSQLILFNTREAVSNVTVAQHLPNLTVIQFLLELRKLSNLKFDFNAVTKNLKIDFWEDCLTAATTIDWSEKAVKGETKIAETKTRLQLGSELDGADALMKDNPAAVQDYITPIYAGYTYGETAKVISKFSTLLTDATTGLAICRQQGVTATNTQLTNTFAPRLLFWHGVTGGKPKATNELNAISLLWNGTNGLAAKSWKETEAMRAKQFYLKKNFVLNEIDLVKLDFSKKVHVGGVNYIIANIEVDNPVTKEAVCLLIGGS